MTQFPTLKRVTKNYFKGDLAGAFARPGYSNPSVQQYIFDKDSGTQAVYEISGTTLNNYLKLVSYG